MKKINHTVNYLVTIIIFFHFVTACTEEIVIDNVIETPKVEVTEKTIELPQKQAVDTNTEFYLKDLNESQIRYEKAITNLILDSDLADKKTKNVDPIYLSNKKYVNDNYARLTGYTARKILTEKLKSIDQMTIYETYTSLPIKHDKLTDLTEFYFAWDKNPGTGQESIPMINQKLTPIVNKVYVMSQLIKEIESQKKIYFNELSTTKNLLASISSLQTNVRNEINQIRKSVSNFSDSSDDDFNANPEFQGIYTTLQSMDKKITTSLDELNKITFTDKNIETLKDELNSKSQNSLAQLRVRLVEFKKNIKDFNAGSDKLVGEAGGTKIFEQLQGLNDSFIPQVVYSITTSKSLVLANNQMSKYNLNSSKNDSVVLNQSNLGLYPLLSLNKSVEGYVEYLNGLLNDSRVKDLDFYTKLKLNKQNIETLFLTLKSGLQVIFQPQTASKYKNEKTLLGQVKAVEKSVSALKGKMLSDLRTERRGHVEQFVNQNKL